MFYILTGPTCAGKSSLCRRFLKEHNNFVTQHFMNPKDEEDGKNQYYTFLDTFNENQDYVLDRFHEGEYIYAPLIRNYTASYLNEIEERFYQMKNIPFFIYAHADLKDVIERVNRRGEDLIKPEQFLPERVNFDKFIKNQHLSYCEIDTSKLNPNRSYRYMLDSMDKYKQILALTQDWKVKPRGDVNAFKIRIVKNQDTVIIRPEIKNGDIWITEDRNVEEQISIIKPKEVIYE